MYEKHEISMVEFDMEDQFTVADCGLGDGAVSGGEIGVLPDDCDDE